MPDIAVDICVCTFRRDHIIDTIESVAGINVPDGYNVHVIVADNDESPSSQEKIEAKAAQYPYPLIYVHAPARNISIARNACLDASRGGLIVFIDDDEIVEKDWLAALLARMTGTQSHAVLGPVKAIYRDDCPDWVRMGDFHSRSATYKDGKIHSGYTANVVFDYASAPFSNLRFREELGQTGGEDSVFLNTAFKAGAVIEYADDAIVSEDIPPDRTRFMWFVKRKFRAGQTHGMMVQAADNSLKARVKNILSASVKALICFAAAPLFIFSKIQFVKWFIRGAMHIGAVSYLLGKSVIIQYGQDQGDKRA